MTKIQEAKKKLFTVDRAVYVQAQKESGLQVGDYVKVVEKANGREFGWANSWEDAMTDNIGKTAEIQRISDSGIQLRIGSTDFGYPFWVLEKIISTSKNVKLNSEYTATVHKDKVQVGCQTFPWSKIQEIIAARNSL